MVGSLPPELGTLSHLLWLEVGGNRGLTGPIPEELGNLSNLESLFLQANWFTGAIPAALGRVGNLKWLGLDQNALPGSIPVDLGNLANLRLLTLAVSFNGNGDMAIDFVAPQHNNGPDHRYGTADDFTMLVTLLNTTPAGCRTFYLAPRDISWGGG